MVNPAIAMGVKQLELPDPLAQYGKIAAIQQAQNQNALAQYQLGAAQRTEASENALNAAYQQSYDPQTGRIDVNKLRQTLATGGFGAKLPGIEKGLGELDAQRLTRVKTQLDFLPRVYQQAALSADPYAAAVAIHDKLHSNPDMGPWLSSMGANADQGLATIQAAAQQGPDAVRQLLLDSAGTVENIASRMKPIEVSPSASIYDPRTRTFTQAPDAPIRPTPSADMQGYELARSQGFKGTFFDYKRQLAEASRAPAQPREPSAPVAVVNEATGGITYVTREEALGRTPASAIQSLPPKEIQKREATYPQATQAVKGFEAKSQAFIKDLIALRDHPGLAQITGLVAGRVPGVTAEGRAAQALYDKVVAKGGFQALQDMRDASKTGGALGNVSNAEGKQLIASAAAIDRRQDAKDVKAAIDQFISDIEGSQVRMREAYDDTYSYRSQRSGTASQPASGATGGWSVVR